MPGARDGQQRIHRGADDPPWTITLYDDAAGQERLPLGRITIEEWLARREEAIEMRWAGPWVPEGTYFEGDVVRVGARAFIATARHTGAAPSLVRADTFTRADQSGLGTASGGQVWTTLITRGVDLDSITSNRGVLLADDSYNWDTLGLGPALSTTSSEMLVRWQDTVSVNSTDGAEVYLNLTNDGVIVVMAQVGLNGTYSLQVGGVTQYHPTSWAGGSADSAFWTRLRHIAGVLSVRTWQDGTAEPAAWDLAVDSGQAVAPGIVGLANIASNPTTAVAYDQLLAWELTPPPYEDAEHWELLAG